MSTVVAIDGPAGAGKSTVARLLAREMGYTYVNTGMLYRAVAYAAIQAHADLNALTPEFVASQQLELAGDKLFLNRRETGEELRSAECSQAASIVSKQKTVRDALLQLQRDAAKRGWIVMEGRDIGTVVFPDAEAKFFITASVEERARRRLAQSGEVPDGADLQRVMAEISERDERDATRKIAPLKPAADAEIVDTTSMSIEQVVAHLAAQLRRPGDCRR